MSTNLAVTDFEQCDAAMMNKLSGFIINNKEVPVHFIAPQGEFEIEEFPAIIIYRNGIYPDEYTGRWSLAPIKDNKKIVPGENPTVEVRMSPEPYLMYYSVRLYYQLQSDGAKLNFHVHKAIPRSAYVKINDSYCDLQFVSYSNPNAGYKNYGEFQEKEPTYFFDQYLFKLEALLELHDPITKVLSTTPVIRVKL